MPRAVPFSVCLLALCAGVHAQKTIPQSMVTAHDGRLWLADREYRAIGVNIPHLSQVYLGTWLHLEHLYGTPEKAKAAAIEALDDAERAGFAFVRFFAGPGYPIEASRLYEKDPEAYWRGMDALFGECRRRGLRVVPCLNVAGQNASQGEPRQAVLDPDSKSRKAMRRFVGSFVSRYRDDPVVLMWELENELLLAADVDMLGQPLLPAAVYPKGATVRTVGERADSLTYAMVERIYREEAGFIRSLDARHPITSGDAGIRPEATSRRETFPDFRFRDDTWREHLANELAAQPEPLDVFSQHHYGPADPGPRGTGLDALARARLTARAVAAAGIPLFIGELGQDSPTFRSDPEAQWATRYLEMADQEGIALVALWVWHFPWQPELTLDGRSHPKLIDRVRAFNARHAAREDRE